MKKKNNTLIILIIIFIISIIYSFINLPKIEWVGVTVLILSSIIIITGIDSIENDPPHFGLVTMLGKKIWKNKKPVIVNEGLIWIFLKGIIFGIIRINIKLKEKRFEPQEILITDNVNVKVPMSYSYNVDKEESHTYINIGSEKGADENINDILEGRLREYSRHPEEGPMTWKEMIASGLKTLDYLIKGLCESEEEEKIDKNDGYDHLIKIDDTIPTPILLDWHREKDPSNSVVKKQWGDGKEKDEEGVPGENKWLILENEIAKLPIPIEELREKIKKRIELLEKLRLGKARIKIPSLGIYLVRLTIGDVNPFGAIYEAEIALQREEKEGKSETYEIEIDILKAEKLKKALKTRKIPISTEECLNLIMKWKLIKEGKGFIYDGQLGGIAGAGDLISSIMKGGKK